MDAARLNDLVYVQCNANLMKRNKRRKDRNVEVLLASDSHTAQEWMIDGVEVVPEPVEETHEESQETHEETQEETHEETVRVVSESSIARGLIDEDSESESEVEVVYEDVDYESDGDHIMEL